MPVDWRAQGNLTNPGLGETAWNKGQSMQRATLRILSDVLLQQIARPSQTIVEKMSKRWEARDTVSGTRWGSIAKIISSACSSHPRKAWAKGAAHGGKRIWEEERVVSSGSHPDALRMKRERGGWRRTPNSLQAPWWLVHVLGDEVTWGEEQHQGWGRKRGTQPARNPGDFVRRAKEAFLMGPCLSSTNLDRAGHFGPFHGSNRRRSSKQMITLDRNHFGFQRAGRPGMRKERKRRRKRREEKSQTRANLNGGELDGKSRVRPTSIVLSSTLRHRRRGLQARANLNGGELD